ncbi:MAG: 50S ribosomal protein L9 [Parachlamydiales bacterium]
MATKILLLKDVDGLGRKGEIVSARPGYIRNYLIPQEFAEIATSQALRKQARLVEERQQQAIMDKQEAEQAASQVAEITLITIVKVDHEGHMYGSVSAHDVIDLLKKQANVEIERRSIQLKHALKTTGKHTIHLKFKEGVSADIKLDIIAEGSEEAAALQA